MKRFFILFAAILALGLSGYAVYMVVFKEDPSVESSEMGGIEAIRPRNMRITLVTDDAFEVEWQTSTSVSGYVKYGDTSNSISLIAQDITGTNRTKKHRVRVSGLVEGRKYYFWVMSNEIAFGRDGRAMEVLTVGE